MIAISAREVMGAVVEEERMTCMNGCKMATVSKDCISVRRPSDYSSQTIAAIIPLQCFRSLLSLANADSSGLSCRLLPFFPLSPHLPASNPSSSP